MKILFETDRDMERSVARITTHPAEKQQWKSIKEAIDQAEKKVTVIHAKNNRQIQVPLGSIAVVESEDRMCQVRLITGEAYLLPMRLKLVEEAFGSLQFLKINNQTIINLQYILEFSSADNARLKVLLKDGSGYYVSRHYIKSFWGRLS